MYFEDDDYNMKSTDDFHTFNSSSERYAFKVGTLVLEDSWDADELILDSLTDPDNYDGWDEWDED